MTIRQGWSYVPAMEQNSAAVAPPDERWLTVRQVATLVGFSEWWVREAVKTKGLPAHKLGTTAQAQLRFRPAEVQEWMESRAAQGAE